MTPNYRYLTPTTNIDLDDHIIAIDAIPDEIRRLVTTIDDWTDQTMILENQLHLNQVALDAARKELRRSLLEWLDGRTNG